MIRQGEIWWAELPEPVGSGAGYRRPVLVVQGDSFNRSRIATVVCVPLTRNLIWAGAPGNVLLTTDETGLESDSVAHVSQIVTLGRGLLTEYTRRVSGHSLQEVFRGIDVLLGR